MKQSYCVLRLRKITLGQLGQGSLTRDDFWCDKECSIAQARKSLACFQKDTMGFRPQFDSAELQQFVDANSIPGDQFYAHEIEPQILNFLSTADHSYHDRELAYDLFLAILDFGVPISLAMMEMARLFIHADEGLVFTAALKTYLHGAIQWGVSPVSTWLEIEERVALTARQQKIGGAVARRVANSAELYSPDRQPPSIICRMRMTVSCGNPTKTIRIMCR